METSSNTDIPESVVKEFHDASGNVQRQIEIINQYRKQRVIDMVRRQTSLSHNDAEFFLTKTKGDVVSAIRLYMSGETRETLNRESIMKSKLTDTNTHLKEPNTVNQKIYSQIRNFMNNKYYN